MLLPDVNVWLALTFDSHVHHAAAKIWFDALTMHQAWEQYDVFRSDPYVSYAVEPTNLEGHWRRFTDRQTFSPKVWNDAYLAAFAQAGGFELVSFDQGLAHYPG